jgi:hypothetical protein
MKILLVLVLCTLFSCSPVTKITKKQIDEFCSHSKVHRDIVMLGLSDDMFEPHSISVHCNCEYGFEFDHETEKCG